MLPKIIAATEYDAIRNAGLETGCGYKYFSAFKTIMFLNDNNNSFKLIYKLFISTYLIYFKIT